jgi:ArsR family transcriptional regulator, lead/cadmium/zinc/bismuth-responsive transcriptional repressor
MQQLMPASRLEVLPADKAQWIARFFQVLSDPTRVRLIKALADGKWCVSDLTQALGMDQPAISHQLRYLRTLGLVKWEREGRRVYYTLDDPLLRNMLWSALDEGQLPKLNEGCA